MRIYLKNNPVKFQPDPIRNDVDFKKKKNNSYNKKMSSNYEIRSWSNNTSSLSNVTVMFRPWPLVIIEAKIYAVALGFGAQLLRSLSTT